MGIDGDYIVTEHFLSGRAKNPISAISRIVRYDLESSDSPVDKQLHDGAKKGDIKMVEEALRNGADINSKNDSRSTALMLASLKGYTQIVQFLVQKGADVNIKTSAFALQSAAMFGHLDIVKYLVENGADINQEVNGENALTRAINFDRHEVTKFLRDSGAIDNRQSDIDEEPDYEYAQEKKSGGCFVATACFDDYDAPEVKLLRNFRDNYLLTNIAGKQFVAFYYYFSPPFAEFLKRHFYLKIFVRNIFLKPIISAIEHWY
ncbi:MAG: ankyrin repeat domain-containing protein [Desulfobacteraceae bacterium]|nr:ankyrin repeat domain-containing protein [Desulfobacteraceae bacterium]